MSRRMLFMVFAAVLAMGFEGEDCSAQLIRSRSQGDHELARLLNIVKKAPQADYRKKAQRELERRGVSRLDIVYALTLDQWLLEPDPIVRYRASAELLQMRSPARMLALTNLRNLIAAETQPDLLWMYAATLSAIAPEMGSALDVLGQNAADPLLRATLALDKPHPPAILRSDNDRAISEMTLSWKEYRKLSELLLLKHQGNPSDSPFIASYSSAAPTRVGTRPATAEKRPKPHPLIIAGKFDQIFKKMEQGSEEYWALFDLQPEKFPEPETAKFLVGQAYKSDLNQGQRAMRSLWKLDDDAQSAAALADALFNSPTNLVALKILEHMREPGPYAQEALRLIRRHGDPEVRAAIIGAMNRSPELKDVMAETIKESLLASEGEMRETMELAILEHRIVNPFTGSWLEEQILTLKDPNTLLVMAGRLKEFPASEEFRQLLFERIDPEQSPELNLVYIGCLLDHVDPKSEAGMKLRRLEKEFEALYVSQMGQRLVNDLQWMIEQTESSNRQIHQVQLEQLEKLNLLDE